MRYNFTGKNVTVTEGLKNRTIEKLDKLDRVLPESAEAQVTFSVVKLEHTVEVTIPLKKRILRAEVTTDDTYTSLDKVLSILDKQVVKYKERLRDRNRKDNRFGDEYQFIIGAPTEADVEEETVISKTKRFPIKPMDPEEAVMEMELLHHNFFVFTNSNNNEVNVVYKRKDGTFGLISPEM